MIQKIWEEYENKRLGLDSERSPMKSITKSPDKSWSPGKSISPNKSKSVSPNSKFFDHNQSSLLKGIKAHAVKFDLESGQKQ